MAQELRTFTQRRTKEQTRLDKSFNQGETEIFNVRAKTLVDQFGNDVVDSKGNKIWFPADFDPAAAVAFGKSLASRSPAERYQNFGHSVEGGGPWDLQRSYNGQRNARFAEVFTPAASYVFGLIGAAADIPQIFLMAGGGAYNVMKNPRTAGSYFGNNPKNVPFIEQGFRDYFESPFAPTVPKDSFQGNPALAPPTDRFRSTFDQASSASPESAPAAPGGWLNSIVRNGEVERIIRDNYGGFDNRFRKWGPQWASRRNLRRVRRIRSKTASATGAQPRLAIPTNPARGCCVSCRSTGDRRWIDLTRRANHRHIPIIARTQKARAGKPAAGFFIRIPESDGGRIS